MKKIKNNLPLTLNSIESIIEKPFATFIINPCFENITKEICKYLAHKFAIKEKITIEEAIKRNLYDFEVKIEPKMKKKEWLLITDKNIYYSKGDNSN